jgi:hypothetical protein
VARRLPHWLRKRARLERWGLACERTFAFIYNGRCDDPATLRGLRREAVVRAERERAMRR